MALSADQRLCKQPAETLRFTMDFSNRFISGESISGVISVGSEKADGSTSDLSITATGLANSSQSVTMFIASGTTGNTYRVETLILTSSNQTIEGDGVLYVRDR